MEPRPSHRLPVLLLLPLALWRGGLLPVRVLHVRDDTLGVLGSGALQPLAWRSALDLYPYLPRPKVSDNLSRRRSSFRLSPASFRAIAGDRRHRDLVHLRPETGQLPQAL